MIIRNVLIIKFVSVIADVLIRNNSHDSLVNCVLSKFTSSCLGEWWGPEGGAIVNGLAPSWEETGEPALSLLSAMWGYNEKTAVCKPRRGPSPVIRSAGTLILDSSVSRTIRRKWFLLKSPSLWHFVMTTWAKIDNRCLYIMPSVPGMVVSTSYIWTHCQVPQAYEVNYYLHFTDEEIRAQRD